MAGVSAAALRRPANNRARNRGDFLHSPAAGRLHTHTNASRCVRVTLTYPYERAPRSPSGLTYPYGRMPRSPSGVYLPVRKGAAAAEWSFLPLQKRPAVCECPSCHPHTPFRGSKPAFNAREGQVFRFCLHKRLLCLKGWTLQQVSFRIESNAPSNWRTVIRYASRKDNST